MHAEQENIAQELKAGGNMSLILGILAVVAGVCAISSPAVAGALATKFVGAFLLGSGILEIIGALRSGGWRAGALGFISGILSLLAGGVILSHTLMTLTILTLVLAIYFLIDGIGKIALAFKVKPEPAWGMVLFSGIITLLLGLMIWRNWPLSGVWAIGTLIGVNMLMSGMNMILLGTTLRSAVKQADQTPAE